ERSAGRCARSGRRARGRAQGALEDRRRLLLQLAARHRARLPAAVSRHARIDGRPRAASRSAARSARAQSAPGVLRDRRGQRARSGHPSRRGARTVRAARRSFGHQGARPAPQRLRRAASHAAYRPVQLRAVLQSRRLIHTVSFPVTLTARNYLKNKVFWVVATETQFLEPQPSRRYVYAQFVPPNLKADEREVPP